MTAANVPMWTDSTKMDRLMNADEVAEHLGVKKQTLYAWRLTPGRGPRAIRVGRYLRWRMSEITAFEETNLEPMSAR